MTKRYIFISLGLLLCILAGTSGYYLFFHRSNLEKGIAIELLDDVPVYDNGSVYSQSHGRHFARSGYYYGQKWQCVEFVKRYLYESKNHKMPDVWGHAISFFNTEIPHGMINPQRAMIQYQQGNDEKPQKGDLIVFSGAGGYGHVAIVSDVGNNWLEIVQQNSPPPRERLPLIKKEGRYTVMGRPALGWLRIPPLSKPEQ